MKSKLAIAITAALLTASCAATQDVTQTQQITPPTVLTTASNLQAIAGQQMTLKQIMADQDWVARSPMNAFWMLDGSGVLYQQKRLGSQVSDWYHQPLDKSAHLVPLDKLHHYAYQGGVYNSDRSMLAYAFDGNILVLDLTNKTTLQLTRFALGV